MSENITSTLTVTDMVSIKNIIDVASARGAFRGEELTAVGEVYTKVSKFIDSVAEMVTEASAESDTSTEE